VPRARPQGAVERPDSLFFSFDAPCTLSMVERSALKLWQATSSASRMAHYVYILRCANSNISVGSTHDLQARLKAHNDGRGAAYTFKHRPVYLVYSEKYQSKVEALNRERQLKHWSHGKKEALILGNCERLKHLSKRRTELG